MFAPSLFSSTVAFSPCTDSAFCPSPPAYAVLAFLYWYFSIRCVCRLCLWNLSASSIWWFYRTLSSWPSVSLSSVKKVVWAPASGEQLLSPEAAPGFFEPKLGGTGDRLWLLYGLGLLLYGIAVLLFGEGMSSFHVFLRALACCKYKWASFTFICLRSCCWVWETFL